MLTNGRVWRFKEVVYGGNSIIEKIGRVLLKKVIYGVDLNSFAVELTSFIFGTPLSFIEHHIKQGNALVGSSIAEGKDIFHAEVKDGLFLSQFEGLFAELGRCRKNWPPCPTAPAPKLKKANVFIKRNPAQTGKAFANPQPHHLPKDEKSLPKKYLLAHLEYKMQEAKEGI